MELTAWAATLHCLTGCAIGEVLGMAIGTALQLGTAATIALAVVLAFLFGEGWDMRSCMPTTPRRAAGEAVRRVA